MRRLLTLALIFFASMIAISLLGRASGQSNIFQEFFQKEKETKKLLLPDMVATKPLTLLIRSEGGKKKLRFSTTFYNKGIGPLEIIGHNDPKTGKTYASQYIYEEDGGGVFKDIGSFVYHPTHSHWHVDQYVFYELWSVKDGHEDERLITTEKMSFCIWDQNQHDLSLDKASKVRVYTHTCQRNTQGMSVGWSDTYSAGIEGQDVDVTGIPDGVYVFKTIINPDRKMEEMDYDNNKNIEIIEIKGNIVTRKDSL
jgi:hypothetical protein